MADYGFNCIKLTDDWQGADFLAYHFDGTTTLKVQLKSRLTINCKYADRDLWMNFPCKGSWYLVPHDDLNQSQGGMCICRTAGIGLGVPQECLGP